MIETCRNIEMIGGGRNEKEREREREYSVKNRDILFVSRAGMK